LIEINALPPSQTGNHEAFAVDGQCFCGRAFKFGENWAEVQIIVAIM